MLPLGTRKHVFLDDALIDQSKNIELALQPPSTSIRVHEDVNGHTSIVEDEDGLLRLYYRGPKDCLAVLTSRDGVTWQAPDLGRVYAGARNVVVRDAVGYGNVFLDPNAPPAERWKYVSGRSHETIFLYWSADGWNFTRGETAVIPLAAGSQSTQPHSGSRSGRDATDDAPPMATAVATAASSDEQGKVAELAVIASNVHAGNGNGKAGNGNGGGMSLALGNVKVAFATQGDAPSCMDCGAIMVRNGSCYKCLNCGSTSGCS